MKISYIFGFLVVCGVFELSQGKKPDCPKILSKVDWGGKPAKAVDYIRPPVEYVIIHHTVTPNCNSQETCSESISNIQKYLMEDLDLDDIGYNFLIGGDGNVYEGAGWHTIGAHTPFYSSRSIGIGFVGNFMNELPNEKQLKAGIKLLKCAVEKGELDPEYKLLGARSFTSTQSPGRALFEEIKKWKGFTETP